MALPPVAALNSTLQVNSSDGNVRVKTERPDEDEIVQLAAKMVEANKAKMAAQAAVAAAAPLSGSGQQGGGRPPGILSYFTSAGATAGARPTSAGLQQASLPSPAPPPSSTPDKAVEKPPMDQASQKGKFGWVLMGEEHLPFILRSEDKYVAVRMVELKLLAKFLNYLNPDIYTCTCIRSYFITESEAKLLNEINIKHSEGRFGRDPFTTKDLVVRKEDANEFYNFLELCYNKLVSPATTKDSRCGFVKINNDSVVPYTVKDDERYVPLFYFEGETETLKKRSTSLGAWDLAYLKFCCKVQGIRSELFANDSCQVISLTDIKAYFPPGTVFDEYWPPKPTDTALLVSGKQSLRNSANSSTASWIKVPHVSSPPVVPDSRLPPAAAAAVSNGWSAAMMTAAAARYQPSNVPVTSQPRSNQLAYSVTSSNNVRRIESSYSSRLQSNNMNQYYTTPNLHSSHNSLGQAQVPPPLVRVSSANPTLSYHSYSKDDWNAYSRSTAPSTYTSSSTVPPNPMYMSKVQYSSGQNNNNPSKYPSSFGQYDGSSRYYGSSGAEVIDLSSPPQSPQRSLLLNGKAPTPQPQPAHQQQTSSRPASGQQQQQQQLAQSNRSDSSGWNKLIPITESPARQSNHCPFKMQKALVSGKMVPCINAKPYVYSELLMTVNDLMEYFFPGVSLAKCREVLQNVLQVTLYSGNLAQKQVLRDNNKCKTLTEILPLIQLKDVMQYMPQLKYILERHMNSSGSGAGGGGESASKRARLS